MPATNDPFAQLDLLDLLLADDQERLADRKRQVLALFERHALLLQALGGRGLLDLGKGFGGHRRDDDGDAMLAVLEAEEIVA